MSAAHVVPRRIYYTIFALLILLTGVTIAVSTVDLGPLNAVAAMTIACTKGTLVVLYFMHARYGSRMVWVVLGAGLLWLVILITMTMGDYASRGWTL